MRRVSLIIKYKSYRIFFDVREFLIWNLKYGCLFYWGWGEDGFFFIFIEVFLVVKVIRY